MSALDRLARWCVGTAARRWPADLSGGLCREWNAELDALRNDPALGRVTRAARAVAFAGSIALSPPVEAAGADPVTWRERVGGAGRLLGTLSGAGLVTLLAAGLFNGSHLAYHRVRAHLPTAGDALADAGLLAAAAAVMVCVAVVAARRCPLPVGRPGAAVARRTVASGLATFAFLLAGNRVAVMPFMGWIDIAPAVVTWTVLTGAAAVVAARCSATGRPRLGLAAGAAGALVALEAATVAGSMHAASELGLGLGSAPVWFPLTLLPGGIAEFGPTVVAAGPTVPALRASDILLGNASAMAGPLLLCSAFLIMYAVRAVRPIELVAVPAVPGRTVPARERQMPFAAVRAGARGAVGAAGAVLAGLIAGAVSSRSGQAVDATLADLRDNATVFGFGFATHSAGRTAVAVLVGIAVFRYAVLTAAKR